jgi:hypothetical protein
MSGMTHWKYLVAISSLIRQPSLLLAGLALGNPDWAALWQKLSPEISSEEVRRNIAITQPLLWLKK